MQPKQHRGQCAGLEPKATDARAHAHTHARTHARSHARFCWGITFNVGVRRVLVRRGDPA
eukprot:7145546-Alexandrium_andersonii.AAC.1